MIKYYLIVELCFPTYCDFYIHHIHGTKDVQYFDSEEACRDHVIEDAEIINQGWPKVVRAACIPEQGV